METNQRTFSLISAEGNVLELSFEAAKHSVLLTSFLEFEFRRDNNPRIHLPLLECNILKLVITFLQHYEQDPMLKIQKPIFLPLTMNEVIQPPFYLEFCLSMDIRTSLQLVLASIYLKIPPLKVKSCINFKQEI